MTLRGDLPMWPSGQRTRLPYAVERDALSGRGLRVRLPKNYMDIFSNKDASIWNLIPNAELCQFFDFFYCGKGIMFQAARLPHLFVHLSGQILLQRYLMNALNSFDKTDREYSLAPTNDFVTL